MKQDTTEDDAAEHFMLTTTRRPSTVGEILTEQFLQTFGMTRTALAEAMAVSSDRVEELCNGRRSVSPAIASKLSRVFGNFGEFWLHVQRRFDLSKSANPILIR